IQGQENLANYSYASGTGKSDTLQLRAWDGLDWSDWVSVKVTNDPLPAVTVQSIYSELLRFADAAYPADHKGAFGTSGKTFDALLGENWRALSKSDLNDLAGMGNDGRFENGNAQAIVAVSNLSIGDQPAVPTLVLSFRGTDFDITGRPMEFLA